MLIGLLGRAGSGKDTVAQMIAPVHLVWTDGKWVDIDALVSETMSTERKRGAIKSKAAQMALADPLKTICRDVYDFSYEQLWGPSQSRNAPDRRYARACEQCDGHGSIRISAQHPQIDTYETCAKCCGDKTTYLTPREALQALGTEWGRAMYGDTWVEMGIRRAQNLISGHQTVQPDEAHTFMNSWIIRETNLVVFSDVRFSNEVRALKDIGGEVWKIVRPSAGLNGSAGQHASETEQNGIPDAEFDRIIMNDGDLTALRRRVAEFM